MGTIADFLKSLGVAEDTVLFLKDQNSVILCIICQIYQTVAGYGVAFVDFTGHDLPLG